MDNKEKITLQTDEGEAVDFFVLEETKLGGINYLLVTDEEDGDGECYILKDTSGDREEEAVYQFVEDEQEVEAVFEIFTQLLDDADVELQK